MFIAMSTISKINDIIYQGDSTKASQLVSMFNEIFQGSFNTSSNTPSSSSNIVLADIRLLASLYPKFLDRLFGDDIAYVPVNNSQSQSTNSTGPWIKGSEGGWLKSLGLQSQSTFDPSNVTIIGKNSSKTVDIGLIEIFYPQSQLFSMLDQAGDTLDWKNALLPSKTQMFLADHPSYPGIESDIHSILLESLLQRSNFDGNEKNTLNNKKNIRMKPIHYFIMCMIRYPTLSHQYLTKTVLGQTIITRSELLHSKGVMAWFERVPYLHLLKHYIEQVLLQGSDSEQALETKQLTISAMVLYWIDLATIVRSNHNKASEYRKLLLGGGPLRISRGEAQVQEKPHPIPSDVVVLDTASFRWTVGTCQCSYVLIWTLLSHRVKHNYSFGTYIQELHNNYRVGKAIRGSARQLQSIDAFEQLLFLQVPLYDMLRCIFSCSGGDQNAVSREVIYLAVDIWLLWIQPWNTKPLGASAPDDVCTWKLHYIAHNLHFYTTLLVSFFNMIAKMNLSPYDSDGVRNMTLLSNVLSAFNNELVDSVEALRDRFFEWSQNNSITQPRIANQPLRTPLKRATSGSNGRPLTRSNSNSTHVTEHELILMRDQHDRLYPDARIRSLSDMGIMDIKTSLSEAGKNIIVAINGFLCKETILKKESSSVFSYVESVLERAFGDKADSARAHQGGQSLINKLTCTQKQVAALVPGLDSIIGLGVESGSATDSASSSHQTWDISSGKLTDQAKEQMYSLGLKLPAKDITFLNMTSSDPLESPLCSFEWHFLARRLIKASKYLNRKYSLPQDNKFIRYSLRQLLDGGFSKEVDPRKAFRFNLRFFAEFRVLGLVGICVFGFLRYFSVVSLSIALVFLVPFIFLTYKGSFPTYVSTN